MAANCLIGSWSIVKIAFDFAFELGSAVDQLDVPHSVCDQSVASSKVSIRPSTSMTAEMAAPGSSALPLSEYEQERAALIARNQERLAELGLSSGSELITRAYGQPAQSFKPAPKLHKVRARELGASVSRPWVNLEF